MKNPNTTKHKEWHSSNQKFGMGDNYGTGIKQKVGTMRQDYLGLTPSVPKKMKTPPTSVA